MDVEKTAPGAGRGFPENDAEMESRGGLVKDGPEMTGGDVDKTDPNPSSSARRNPPAGTTPVGCRDAPDIGELWAEFLAMSEGSQGIREGTKVTLYSSPPTRPRHAPPDPTMMRRGLWQQVRD
jgi:hypothetical protein